MSMKEKIKHNKGSVCNIKYHIVWIPRRRRKVLVGKLADRLEELLRQKANEIMVDIQKLAIQPDHVHLFVSAPPSLSISQIVFRLKGYTARVLRQEFDNLKKMPSMWTTSYYVGTIGHISQETVEKYIAAQSKRA